MYLCEQKNIFNTPILRKKYKNRNYKIDSKYNR